MYARYGVLVLTRCVRPALLTCLTKVISVVSRLFCKKQSLIKTDKRHRKVKLKVTSKLNCHKCKNKYSLST
ncbi:hypothetical protein evm_000282 [Chilo suppressalis]|nr:hypothetical protein evm_000282 [Chilo suppressalis]